MASLRGSLVTNTLAFEERDGEHGGDHWYDELPSMVAWAFGR